MVASGTLRTRVWALLIEIIFGFLVHRHNQTRFALLQKGKINAQDLSQRTRCVFEEILGSEGVTDAPSAATVFFSSASAAAGSGFSGVRVKRSHCLWAPSDRAQARSYG